MSAALLLASAAIMLALGLVHLLFTFKGNKLHPRDPALLTHMQSTNLVIARTSVWNAWIGFNASHSLGAILFGTVYGYLALIHPAILFASTFLGVNGLLALVAYLALARRYWFVRPFQGIALATLLYVGGFASALLA